MQPEKACNWYVIEQEILIFAAKQISPTVNQITVRGVKRRSAALNAELTLHNVYQTLISYERIRDSFGIRYLMVTVIELKFVYF